MMQRTHRIRVVSDLWDGKYTYGKFTANSSMRGFLRIALIDLS